MRKATIVLIILSVVAVILAIVLFGVNLYNYAYDKGFSDGNRKIVSEYVSANKKTDTAEKAEVEEIESKQELNEDDVFCLAAVIYQEAGSDYLSDDLRRMVADVVLNRVADDRFPNTIRGVLEDAPNGCRQYGSYSVTGVQFPKCTDEDAEKRAYRIAEDVLCGNHTELYGNGYVWQANFVQGNDGFWKEGVYFAK